ncbi:hypothetical protein DOY81_006881 [Sarcophaga bullata]|nr:hypothetical protein DOY81_006881 [Sarcophaga bullata]
MWNTLSQSLYAFSYFGRSLPKKNSTKAECSGYSKKSDTDNFDETEENNSYNIIEICSSVLNNVRKIIKRIKRNPLKTESCKLMLKRNLYQIQNHSEIEFDGKMEPFQNNLNRAIENIMSEAKRLKSSYNQLLK